MDPIKAANAAEFVQQPQPDFAPIPDSWPRLLLIFLVLLFCSWLGIVLSRQSEGVSAIWLTNGILLAIVVARPPGSWVRYFVIGFLADTLASNIVHEDPLRLSLGLAAANSIEVITSCLLLTRWFGTPLNLSRLRPLLGFLGVAVIGATALTSALGASLTPLFVDAGSWWPLFRTWYLGDLLGMAILGPLVFILQRPDFFNMLQRQQLPRTLALLSVPAIVTALVFNHSSDPLTFFIFPALLLVVFQLGFPGTVVAICATAAISIGFTIAGRGPLMLIHDATMPHRIVVEQIFVAVVLFTTFPVAALLEEREILQLSLQKSEVRYRELANADALTGLANRRGFDEQLEAEWQRALSTHQSVAILLLDVDLFKSYNDIYGHIGGDECLRCIANVIAGALQRSSDRASRFGGEEFAIILSNTEIPSALIVGENIRQAILTTNLPHPRNPNGRQTISVGVAAAIPTPEESSLFLLTQADRALYRAKDLGRNRVEAAIPTDYLVLNQPSESSESTEMR